MAESAPQVIVKIKRRRGHGGHHGGAWKVAYADFVTAMMALFIVLWLLTQADLALRQQIARYFRNPGVLSGGNTVGETSQTAQSGDVRPLDAAISLIQGTGEEVEALRGKAREIERMLETSPELEEIKSLVQISVSKQGLEIQIVDTEGQKDLLFDVASAELKPALVTLLQKLAEPLGRLPNRLRIGGHTDARPFAPDAGLTNWDLAFSRANSARKIMEGNGLRPDQVEAVIAYADSKLLNTSNPYAPENRRLSVTAVRENADSDDGDDAEDGDAAAHDATDGAANAVGAPDEAQFAPRLRIPGLPPD
jgi:chemotaxis protein MotB